MCISDWSSDVCSSDLNYYHGHPAQLFDLEADPQEQADLASDPNFAELRAALTARVLAGWDPARIGAYMEARNRDKALLNEWQETMRPESTYVWPMRAEQNWLLGMKDGDQIGRAHV